MQAKEKNFLKKELFNSMLIIEKNYISSVTPLKGSWAGAMGQSQFMPSSFLNYAVDYNNDKKIDIWNNYEDIFASIANYLNKHGWHSKKCWSNEIKLRKSFERST